MKLFYRKAGEGLPLIILHGLFGSSDNWNSLAKYFSQFFTVYSVDLRNHGQSPHSELWNYSIMAEDVIELCKDENLKKVNIIGHSMGGKVAIETAALNCDIILNLLVVDISVKYYPPHHQNIFEALHAVDPPTCLSRKDAEERIRTVLNDESTIQFLLKNLYWNNDKLSWRMNVEVIENNILEVGKQSTLLSEECRKKFKTYFIKGEKSNYIKEEETGIIHEYFPNAQIHSISGAGHWVQAEKPKEFAELVMQLLNTNH